MKYLFAAVIIAGASILAPAATTQASSGPAAHYASGYSGWWWCDTYALHRSWGNAVGGEYCSPDWYFCVHPAYAPGSWLTVSGNGRTIDCFVADMVQPAHQAQWYSKWVIELSWPAFVALGLPLNNYATLGPTWEPAAVPEPAPQPAPPAARTFDETGYGIGGAFKTYWEENGGLMIFGYPLTNEYDDNGMTIQIFERAVFEWHPENNPEHRVLLRRLGAKQLP